MPAVVIIYILLCVLVGVLGRERKPLGLWGWFFFALVLTPVIGAFALLIVGPQPPPQQR